jgi:hypothetical protein
MQNVIQVVLTQGYWSSFPRCCFQWTAFWCYMNEMTCLIRKQKQVPGILNFSNKFPFWYIAISFYKAHIFLVVLFLEVGQLMLETWGPKENTGKMERRERLKIIIIVHEESEVRELFQSYV